MIGIRRHPDGVALSAWYDGEVVDPRLAAHVDSCERCWATVSRFAAVDEAVRGGPLPSFQPRRGPRRAPVWAAVGVAAAVAALAVVGAPAVERSSVPVAGGRGAQERPPSSPTTVLPGNPAPDGGTSSLPPGVNGAGPAVAATSAAGADAEVGDLLRLGVPLPGGDPRSSSLAAEVWHAAQVAAAEHGRVEVVPVPAGGPFPSGLDAVVGGWGSPAPVLLQTLRQGVVVIPADPDPEQAGALLARAAVGDREVVGVISGVGPDAAFGDGVAASRRVVATDLGAGSSCEREVRTVMAQGAVAIALAAPPPDVRACLAAMVAAGVRPPRGVLVPPSMALDPEPPPVTGIDVVGLVGLPMPTSNTPGATRFREMTGAASYRALLTFAGVELAVALDATGPDMGAAWRRDPTWHGDLVSFHDGRNLGVHAVRAASGGWEHYWDSARFSDERDR